MKIITLKFDLPFSLRVDGSYTLSLADESFQLSLSTYFEPDPTMPGAERLENVAIVNDEGASISHTIVEAMYTPVDQSILNDPAAYLRNVAEIALSIANALVAGVRSGFGEYAIDYLYSSARLGPISCSGAITGNFDSLGGGITFLTPSRSGSDVVGFAKFLEDGAKLSVEQELYFDARRYLLRGNKRMALVNLAISFEVRLSHLLGKIAIGRNDNALEKDVHSATMAKLGQQYAAQLFGASLENRAFWGNETTKTFNWMRNARNSVLHKATMILKDNSIIRDFNQDREIEALFREQDNLVVELEKATGNVMSGRPAR